MGVDQILSDKNDSADGVGPVEFTDAPVNGDTSGDWTINGLFGLDKIVIVLKAGNGFAGFLLDLAVGTPLDGTWSTDKTLSHASIYYNGTPNTIPVPAALPLFASALVGFGLMARRRSKR